MPFAKNAWYVAAHAHEVTEELLGRQIVGERILLTRDASGKARAIGDRCPHRFAPLHQGKRESDLIECPYHGLKFGLDGKCRFNPHGAGRIPGAARVPSYPVEERDGVIWIWPGDSGLANADEITDLQLIHYEGYGTVNGHIVMPVDYRLVLDNLLDLSHAQYIHAGTLSPGRSRREVSQQTGERSVKVNAFMPDCKTPSSQALIFDGERGDFYSSIEWVFPGTLRHQLSMTEVGTDPATGAVTRNAHLITPETETSTHYFWIHTRGESARPHDEEINATVKKVISHAFIKEDEPMIAACQAYMDGKEFFSLKPLYLATDYAGTRCRREMERLIAEEQKASVREKAPVAEAEGVAA